MLLRVSCCCIHQALFICIFSEFFLNINKKKILKLNTKYSYKHQSILSFNFALHNNNLFSCLHLLTSSDLLFNKFQSPRNLMIENFSVKHDLLQFGETLLLTLFPLLQLTIGAIHWFFNCGIYFESSLHFTYFLCLKSRVRLLYLSLNEVSAAPRYLLHLSLSFVLIVILMFNVYT